MLKVGRWRVSRPVAWVLAGLAGLILLALIGWAIWRVPQLFYSYVSDPKDRANAEATTRTGILAGLAGIAALVSLRFTARAAQVSQETFQLTRRGQLTERYTKAIDQLGSKTLDVRMGGIYALEQLVREFDSDQDQKTIVEVLSAFTREHSNPVYRYRSHLEWLGQEKQEQPVPEKRSAIEHVSNYPLPGDVQAAITVLGRLPLTPATQADLMGAYLRSVRLQPTDHLVGAQLGPVLDDKANLSEAKLVQVDLSKADLHQATLIKAKLDEANLTGAWLAGADLSGAHLRGANLTEAKLVGVLVNGIWYGLEEARGNKIPFSGEDLVCANLTKADLTEVHFTGADLSAVDLAATEGLKQEQINKACGDESTKLPNDLKRPKKWTMPRSQLPNIYL